MKQSSAIKLLLAAKSLEETGKTPFSAEELTVAAWRMFPESFGMTEPFDYPDTNRACATLMGKKGLTGKGLLRKTGEKMYCLSDLGKKAIDTASAGGKVKLEKQDPNAIVIRRLVESEAMKKFNGCRDNITFGDACSFWEIGGITGPMVATKISLVQAGLETLRDKAVPGDEVLTEANVRVAGHLHQWMADKFRGHLELLKRR